MTTWKATYRDMTNVPATPQGGSGGGASYSSREDMASYLRSSAFRSLGRALTKPEMDAAIARVRSAQIAASGAGGATAPTLASASDAAVLSAAPEEAAAYGLGSALDILFKKHGAA